MNAFHDRHADPHSPHDVLAPDGSEIRVLTAGGRSSMVHCTLPPGGVSMAVRHRSVEELWYVLEGRGEIWRRLDTDGTLEECVLSVEAGTSLNIPLGAHFQFRTLGEDPLRILIVTTPPWPGEDEAVRVADHWPTA